MRLYLEDKNPYCEILYKTENLPGWKMGRIGLDKKDVIKYCEEKKSQGIWADYKIYMSGTICYHYPSEFTPHSLSAYDAHLTTDLIYNSYDEKWYRPEDTIPLPKTDAKLCKDFHLKIIPEDLADWPLWDKDDFEGVTAIVKFHPCRYKYKILVEDLNVARFLRRLKKYGYAELIVEEYTFCKFLAWKTNGNILFILQNYDVDDVEEALNILVPEQEFYAEFIKLDESIKYLSARLSMLFAEFKATELFLRGLRWEYDVEKPQEPQEYTLLSWNQDCLDKFKRFVRKVKREECSYDKRTHFGKYKYWYDEKTGKLSREYKYREGLAEFIASDNFKHRDGITLREIFKQQMDGGNYTVLEGNWENKKFIIYANGDAVFKKTKIHIPELEALVRQVVRDSKNKPTISTSKLWDLLEEAGVDVTIGRNRYPMNIKNL